MGGMAEIGGQNYFLALSKSRRYQETRINPERHFRAKLRKLYLSCNEDTKLKYENTRDYDQTLNVKNHWR